MACMGASSPDIKSLIEDTGTEIDVDEDEDRGVGIVNISCTDQEKIDDAVSRIKDMMHEIQLNEEFDGKITRIEDYGIFVAIPGNKEGLVHVSAMSMDYVRDPRTLVNLGDIAHVRVAEIKDDGKIGLSMLSKEDEAAAREQRHNNSGSSRGGSGFNRSSNGFNRGGNNSGRTGID